MPAPPMETKCPKLGSKCLYLNLFGADSFDGKKARYTKCYRDSVLVNDTNKNCAEDHLQVALTGLRMKLTGFANVTSENNIITYSIPAKHAVARLSVILTPGSYTITELLIHLNNTHVTAIANTPWLSAGNDSLTFTLNSKTVTLASRTTGAASSPFIFDTRHTTFDLRMLGFVQGVHITTNPTATIVGYSVEEPINTLTSVGIRLSANRDKFGVSRRGVLGTGASIPATATFIVLFDLSKMDSNGFIALNTPISWDVGGVTREFFIDFTVELVHPRTGTCLPSTTDVELTFAVDGL